MAEPTTPVPGRIFISYRREDTDFPAGWLYERLADHFDGGQVFKDVDSIQLGDDFVEVITNAVGSCDVLLAVIGDRWLTITDEDGQRRLDNSDDFVRLEIEAALARQVRVIPILVDGARIPGAEELPDSLAGLVRRQALELSPTRFAADTNRLLTVLDRTLIEVRAQTVAKNAPGATALPAGPPPVPEPPVPEPPVPEPPVPEPPVPEPPAAGPKPKAAAPPPAPPPPVASKQRSASRRPLARWWLAAAAVLSAVLLLVAFMLRPQPPVTVPSPGSASVADVVVLLQRVGLEAKVTRAASDTVATGKLIRTAPSAGAKVRRGTQVTLFVSSGPQVTPLPPGTTELTVGFVDRFAVSKDNPESLLNDFRPILFPNPTTGRPQGLDVDLAEALGKKLDVSFTFKGVDHFTHSLSDVKNQQVDIGMSVLRDRPEGRKDVDYIDYLRPGTVLLVPKGNPGRLRSLQDLCGRKVVRPIEMPAGSVVDQSHQCEEEGEPAITLVSCPKIGGFEPDGDEGVRLEDCPAGRDPLRLVIDGWANAAVLDLPVAERLMETSTVGGRLEIARPHVQAGPYGIAIGKGDRHVRDALQSALQAIIADGTYGRILARWHLQRLAVRAATVNGGP
jgi:ABC-type amino acid transport substrate-binding protein